MRKAWFTTVRLAVRSRWSPLNAQRLRSDNVEPAPSAAQVRALRPESDVAHHRRFCVICVICVIASYRSKPNPQPRNDLRTIIVTPSSASSASSGSSSASLRHTDRSQPPATYRLAHHHRHCVIGVIRVVIGVIASYRSKPIPLPRTDLRHHHRHCAICVIPVEANPPAAIRLCPTKDRVWME